MKILFMDTETGGLDPRQHSLLQVGLVAYEDGTVLDDLQIGISKDLYVITPQAMNVNKLDLGELQKNGVKEDVAVLMIMDFIKVNFGEEKPVLAGHNISFDKDMVKSMFDRVRIEKFENYVSSRMIDTMSLLWGLYNAGKVPKSACSSEGAFKYFNIDVDGRHTALADAHATVKLYEKLLDLIKGELKVYEINDYDWVCAPSKEEAKRYYLKQTGLTEDDIYPDKDIRECDLDKEGMWVEYEGRVRVKELEAKGKTEENSGGNWDIGSMEKRGNTWFIKVSFREAISWIQRKGSIPPCIIASIEW